MSDASIVALLSLAGTIIGSLLGILAAVYHMNEAKKALKAADKPQETQEGGK